MIEKITIYVDADACPVKDEVLKVAYRHNIKTFFVSNAWLRMETGPLVQKIVVSEGADEADNWIADNIKEHDIAITADIPLAKRCLENKAIAMGPAGRLFTPENIGMALAMRELNQHRRETGESKGHNPSFTKSDRSSFLQNLETEVQKSLRR